MSRFWVTLTSISKWVLVHNLSYGDEFSLQKSKSIWKAVYYAYQSFS